MLRHIGMRNQLSIPVTALALLALAACGTESGSGSGSGGDGGGSVTTDLPLTGVHWTVDSVTVDGKKSAAPNGAHVEITDKGRAQGNYGCNQFGAAVKVEGDTVTVGKGEMTEMGCAEDIQGFEEAMKDAFTGKLKAKLVDKNLTLTTPKGDSITLTSEPAAPLAGTKWTVNSLLTGDVATSLPAGTEKNAWFTLAKDGSVRGSLGCNTFSSTAKVSGSTHHLRPPGQHPEDVRRHRGHGGEPPAQGARGQGDVQPPAPRSHPHRTQREGRLRERHHRVTVRSPRGPGPPQFGPVVDLAYTRCRATW